MIWNIKTTLDYQLPSPFETEFGLVYLHLLCTNKHLRNVPELVTTYELHPAWFTCRESTSKPSPTNAFSKLFIKDKNHQRIRTNRVYFNLPTFVFKISMSKTLPKAPSHWVDCTAVSIFLDILVELTNTVFVKSTKISTHIETAVLSTTALSTLSQLSALTHTTTFFQPSISPHHNLTSNVCNNTTFGSGHGLSHRIFKPNPHIFNNQSHFSLTSAATAERKWLEMYKTQTWKTECKNVQTHHRQVLRWPDRVRPIQLPERIFLSANNLSLPIW